MIGTMTGKTDRQTGGQTDLLLFLPIPTYKKTTARHYYGMALVLDREEREKGSVKKARP